MSTAPVLLPCPFCGGEAHISTRMDEDIWSHNTVPYTTVTCGDCDIGTNSTCEGWDPTAQEAWNRRDGANADVSAYIASLVAERDALAMALNRLLTWLRPAGAKTPSTRRATHTTPLARLCQRRSRHEPRSPQRCRLQSSAERL
jgi:hypothetical protein